MKILAAVDGSPYTRRMLAYLAAHEEWLGPAVPPRAAAVIDKAALKSYYDDTAEKVFKPLRTFCEKQGLRVNFVNKIGSAAEVISDMAKKGEYTLLVLGSHGHGTLGNLVMGSVATKVLANCTTPVLLIR